MSNIKFLYIFLSIIIASQFVMSDCVAFNKKDKVWQPYQLGDSMVYVSNKGEMVMDSISEIKKAHNPSDEWAPWKHWIHTVWVDTRRVYPPSRENFRPIIQFDREKLKKTVYYKPQFKLAPERTVIIKEKHQKNLDTIQYNQHLLFKITPHSQDYSYNDYVDSIYWSPQVGFVKVFYHDGDVWELVTFYRGGEVLYKKEDK